MQSKRDQIVTFGIILEFALAVVYFIYASIADVPTLVFPKKLELISGFVASIPIFILNYIFFKLLINKLPSFQSFKSEVISPLVKELDVKSAFMISVAAGFGEELFFRGFLQVEIGLIASSILFSLLHFAGLVKKYLAVAIVYFLVSLYLGLLFQSYQSLWVPIGAHFLYDFLVLLILIREDNRLN